MGLDDLDLRGKRLLILDGTRIAREIVREAQRMGIVAVVTDYNTVDNAPAKQIADEHHQVSTTDVQDVIDLIATADIDGVVAGFSDLLLPFYAQICKGAGLPCYGSEELFRLFTDKNRYKALCEQHGVPVIEGYTVDEALDEDRDVKFPLLIKPADGSGSRGVTVCRVRSEVSAALATARKHSRTGEILVERYLNGEEATAFWIFQDGAHYLSMLANRHVVRFAEDTPPLPVGYTAPSAVLPRYEADVVPRVRAMLEASGVRNGMMFMQGIIDDGLFRMYDIGFRLTGTQEYRLLEATRGFNPLRMLIRFALTGSMGEPTLAEKTEAPFPGYAYNVSTLMQPGTIERIEGVTDILNQAGVISSVEAHVVGETLPPEARGQLRQITVRTLGTATTREELEMSLRSIDAEVRVIGSEGRDLTLRGLDLDKIRTMVL